MACMITLSLLPLLISGVVSLATDLTEDILAVAEENNVTVSNSIVGLFDLLTDATQGAGTLFEGFEEGFQAIQPLNETDGDSINGSSIVVGLFDSVRDVTKNVGNLIGALETNLVDNREDIVNLANNVEENVDNKVQNLGSDVQQFGNSIFTTWVQTPAQNLQQSTSNLAGNVDETVQNLGSDVQQFGSSFFKTWVETPAQNLHQTTSTSLWSLLQPVKNIKSLLANRLSVPGN